MTNLQKIIVGAGLFAVWIGFAINGDTPVQPIIDSVKLALGALGIYHMSLTNPKE